MSVDITNKFLVSVRGNSILILNLPAFPPQLRQLALSLSPDEALVFAAWLVALAGPMTENSFTSILAEVENS